MCHKDRRSYRDVWLQLASRKLRALQEREPEHRVDADSPHGQVHVLEHAVDADAVGTDDALLPTDVRSEVREVQAYAEVDRAQLPRKPVASAYAAGERAVERDVQRRHLHGVFEIDIILLSE